MERRRRQRAECRQRREHAVLEMNGVVCHAEVRHGIDVAGTKRGVEHEDTATWPAAAYQGVVSRATVKYAPAVAIERVVTLLAVQALTPGYGVVTVSAEDPGIRRLSDQRVVTLFAV